MIRVKFIIIGGFLGAGKTTSILRLAAMYAREGVRVGIITNDLGPGNVDTLAYRAAGLAVEEIRGACFAFRLPELIHAAGRLQDGYSPDILIAEPSGTCIDLVAKVLEPLSRLYSARFAVAPYVTLLDPFRAREALMGSRLAGFSKKVTYLFRMQQTEAAVVAVNKADTLSPSELDEILGAVSRSFRSSTVLGISAGTGQGFDELILEIDHAQSTAPSDHAMAPLQVQAPGNQLSWLNGRFEVRAGKNLIGRHFFTELVTAIGSRLSRLDAEPGHVKFVLRSGEVRATASLVGSGRPAEYSGPPQCEMLEARLCIDASVEYDPRQLKDLVCESVQNLAQRHGIEIIHRSVKHSIAHRAV